MPKTYTERAPFNDWWYWSECLGKRYRTISEIYRENDELERSQDALAWGQKIRDNCMVPVNAARKGMKTDAEKAEVKRLEEDAIFSAAAMFREVLANLPFISSAIQGFVGATWEDCAWPTPEDDKPEFDDNGLPIKKKKKRGDGRLSEFFWGPKTRTEEGIRSGLVGDGGLPGILNNLLVNERTTSSRSPTDYGQMLQASATQNFIATSQQKWEKAGIKVNLKPTGSI